MTLLEIQSKINGAKELDFGTVLSECIELFKKFWAQGLLTIVIIAVITVPIALLSEFILKMLGIVTSKGIRFDDFKLENLSSLYGINMLYNFPFSIISSFIQISVLAAFYRMIKIKEVENVSNDDYFYFFKKDYFGKTLLLAMIYASISLACQLMCFIPMIYAVVPLMFISVIFAYHSEKSIEEIIKISFSLGNKKWLLTFGSLFICLLLGMLGLIACFIGVFFTISIVYFPAYAIYKHVVGFEDAHELDQIGKTQEF
ncbi:MAG: hypothetical protein R2783_00590 [Gelidibacter sp.]